MGTEFFSEWALWEKMTFVLACGIVLTIALGCCKLWYDHWRIRKYKAIASAKGNEAPPVAEANNAVEEKDAIPFGIRAIESGIEVDGVWISRTNTPAPDSPVSNASNAQFEATPTHSRVISQSDLSRIDLPQPACESQRVGRAHSRAASSAFDRAVSADLMSTATRSRAGSQSKCQPSSYSRYSNNTLLRNSSRLDLSESLGSSGFDFTRVSQYDSSHRHQTSESSHGTDPSSDDGAPLQPQAPTLQTQEESTYDTVYLSPKETQKRSFDPGNDLDLLQSHRLSHVAETGQLTPRIRQPAPNSETTINRSKHNRLGTVENISSHCTTPPPQTAIFNPFVTPPETPVPPMTPPEPPKPVLAQNATPPEPQETFRPPPVILSPQPQRVIPSFQPQRNSQVLRKVNSGFEIMRPGSFGTGPSDIDGTTAHGDRSESKHLQKRRKSSGYRVSSFIEQV